MPTAKSKQLPDTAAALHMVAPEWLDRVEAAFVQLIGPTIDRLLLRIHLDGLRSDVLPWIANPSDTTIAAVLSSMRALPAAVEDVEDSVRALLAWRDKTPARGRDRRAAITRLRRAADHLCSVTRSNVGMGAASEAADYIARIAHAMRAYDAIDGASMCAVQVAKARGSIDRAKAMARDLRASIPAAGGRGTLFERVARTDARAVQWLYELVAFHWRAASPSGGRLIKRSAVDPLIATTFGGPVAVGVARRAWRDARRVGKTMRAVETGARLLGYPRRRPLLTSGFANWQIRVADKIS